ncbi:MAG TPA: hypothetical protein DCZ75_05945 [Geobacter sp.]|nr:hypothetical protein [Geobacter sp.]
MTQSKSHEWAKGVSALAVVLAVLIWLSVMLERTGEITLTVPVYLGQLPPGMILASPAPADIEVTVSGPRILLLLLPLHGVACDLDVSALGPGEVKVAPREGNFHLDRELKVVRVLPATVPLVLARAEKK